jgi:adenine-specific DNA methylase
LPLELLQVESKEILMNQVINIDGNQLNLFDEDLGTKDISFRPIHYLGSKLRILDFIQSVIDEIDPTKSRVCDLFSGSGTVSHFLSKSRPVTSIDIQEYSRVITSAVLQPMSKNYDVIQVISDCKNSEHYKRLIWSMEPLLQYEVNAVEKALSGDLYPLCELVEYGTLISFENGLNDILSVDLLSALKEASLRLNKSNFILGPEALVSRYFGGAYFSFSQSVELDALLEYASMLNTNDKDIFTAAILSTASEVVNTVGKQFAQPIKPFNADGTPKKNIVKRIVKDRSFNVFNIFIEKLQGYQQLEKSSFNHFVYRMDYSDALDILNKDVRVVYADPPYTRYHYSRYYHVLETLCLRDNPRVSKITVNGKEKLSRGIYRDDRHQSPFSIKSKAAVAFDTLFHKVSKLDASLVLSYSPYDENIKSTPRVQTIDELESLGNKYFNSVEIISVGQFSHSKLNHSDKNFEISYDAEKLIVCKK